MVKPISVYLAGLKKTRHTADVLGSFRRVAMVLWFKLMTT